MSKLVLLCLLAACCASVAAERLRPPSVPLVAHDPYFSVWLPADRLTDADSTHWTGKPQPLHMLLRIDGQVLRLLGRGDQPALPQTDLEVTPTRTLVRYANAQVRVELAFITPALPAELDVLARPLTYLVWDVAAVDGQPHAVQLLCDAGAELAVNTPEQTVHWNHPAVPGLRCARVGSNLQPVLGRKGDDLRVDWGYAWLAVPEEQAATVLVGPGAVLRAGWSQTGAVPYLTRNAQPRAVRDDVALTATWDLGTVGAQPVRRWALLAYDDRWSIRYFGSDLRPYWRRAGETAEDLLTAGLRDAPRLWTACETFDRQLVDDLTAAGGAKYAQLCTLAYRQTWAGNKVAADPRGMPLVFPKENFSNGCIGTVDVLFPQAPFFLTLSPALARGMLQPILAYADSPLWPYGYAPHDLGTYPHATGQVYGMGGGDGGRMPVEESGNMLIMLAALAKVDPAALELCRAHWPLLTRWAAYLRDAGLDPENQLCSADMFGHLPHCANLALKAIIALGGYAQLCERLGRADDAARYWTVARDYSARWQTLAADEGRTRLAYNLPGGWGMKHNLIWDRVLGTRLFPDAVGDAEVAWYRRVQQPFGLPVDNRTDTSLLDWAMWSIAPARGAAEFEALVAPLWRYAHETPSRVPLSDWFVTGNGRQRGFQARPVVGGLFIRLLADEPRWRRYAAAATPVRDDWAPLVLRAATDNAQVVVPCAQQDRGLRWRYTTERPADDWVKPEFDDHAWREGPGGFGTAGTPGALLGTVWNTADIWLRRGFDLKELPSGDLHWLWNHDEDLDVYLNGQLAGHGTWYITGYETAPLSAEARQLLRVGRNTLAIHCHQTTGGQYADVGLLATPAARPAVVAPPEPEGNPVLPGYFADPSLSYHAGRYWIHSTTDWYGWEAGPFVAWQSEDLRHWRCDGSIFPEVAGQRNWAPGALVARGGKYYLFFSKQLQIHVAVADSPNGPFKDALDGRPLIPRGFRKTQSIDSEVLIDDDGKAYLYWGGGPTFVAPLRDDLLALAGEPVPIPTNDKFGYVEGPFPFKRHGIYYLTGAANGYHNYHIIYGMATSPLGPFTFPDDNPITLLDWEAGVWGPGHGSIFNRPGTDEWFVCYLRNFPRQEVPVIPRQVALDRLEFYPNGHLKPVKLTRAGLGASAADLARGRVATASSSGGGQYGERGPQSAVDGSFATRWVAASDAPGQWWQVDLGEPRDLATVEVYPEFPTKVYRYQVETSLDGTNWTAYGDHGDGPACVSPQVFTRPARARYVRVTFSGTEPRGTLPGLWEVRVR